MKLGRLKTLLVLVLVTNLLTNVVVLAILGLGIFAYVRLSSPPEEDAEDPMGAPRYEVVQESSQSVAGAVASGPDLGRLSLSAGDWEKLVSGKSVRETASEDGRARIHARFLVKASREEIYELLSDCDRMTEIYEDLDRVELKKRVRSEETKYDIVWFEGSSAGYRLVYCLRKNFESDEAITWTLVAWPGTSDLLRACRGAWRFHETGVEGITLVEYENEIELPALPDFLLETLVDRNLPHAMAAIRKILE